jgi:hypothetical protein
MLLKHLPDQIKTLAITRQLEQNGKKDELIPLFESFDWNKSPEGFTFWESVNCGIYTPFNEKYETNYENEDWLIGGWDEDEQMLKQEYESLSDDSIHMNMAYYWDSMDDVDIEYLYSEYEHEIKNK